MRFTRLILALTSFLILITQTDLFASTVLHKTSMVDLSNNAIICMHQDPDGYLWIGTYDGLNLYNGKDTYVYRFELNNKNSLFEILNFLYPLIVFALFFGNILTTL